MRLPSSAVRGVGEAEPGAQVSGAREADESLPRALQKAESSQPSSQKAN